MVYYNSEHNYFSSNICVDQKLIMGKAIGVYVGLIWIYLNLIFKRGLVGIISLFVANTLYLIIIDVSILRILKFYCIISILLAYFIDYKNERYLFKILNISSFSQRVVKIGIIMTIVLIQWLVFLIIENDKIN